MTKEMIGRESIVDYIKLAVAEGKVSHAYILEGEKGMGKLFVAEYFAKTLLCTSKKEEERKGKRGLSACKECTSCRQAEGHNHPDIIYVEHEKPNLVSIDDIREQLVSTVDILPYASDYKIYIVKDADKMNEKAQNTILKTLEEPPEYVIIFLLSANKGRLLDTIKSRCVTLDVKPVEKDEIKAFLIRKYEVPDYLADQAAEFSAGNIGKAIRYVLEDDFLEMKNQVVGVMRRLDYSKEAELIADVEQLATFKNEIKDCLDLMVLWFRDMLVLKATRNMNRLIFKDEYAVLKEQAEVRSYEAVDKALEAIEKAKQRLDANVKFETVIEVMISSLKEK